MSSLTDRTKKLRLGDGLLAGTDVGPCVNEKQRESVNSYVEIGQKEGATLAAGGSMAKGNGLDKGWFYEPTIFTGVTPEMRIAKEEIFGPVLFRDTREVSGR